MKRLIFYGASDDLFEMDGDITEELNVYGKPGKYHLKSADGEMIVVGEYAPRVNIAAVWMLSVAHVDDGTPFPPWPMVIREHSSYSPAIVIDAADDVQVACSPNPGEDE